MKLGIEELEGRRLMASDWQNSLNPLDTDGSGLVQPIDLLHVINDLNAQNTRTLGSKPANYSGPLCDVNGDGLASPLDMLFIINALRRYEGDQSLSLSFDQQLDPNLNGSVMVSGVRFSGNTMKDSTIEVWQGEGTGKTKVTEVLASPEGRFDLDFNLPTKLNTLTFVTKDKLGRTLQTERILRYGDVIAEWNATLLRLTRETTSTAPNAPEVLIKPPPPMVARNLAMVHLAMFDAINAISRTYESYAFTSPASAGISAEVAAAAAAHRVATELFNADFARIELDQTLSESLATIPDGQVKGASVTFGRLVGDAVLARRASDGSQNTASYQPGSDPGDWNRTPPTMTGPALPQWPGVTPFVMQSGDQFRPAPPPALSSSAYAAAVDEVMKLGAANSLVRTQEQTAIAEYWSDGGGTATPPGHWNQIAIDQGLTRNHSLLENARMMAVLNMALADAGIASWDAKYHYDLWRPIDAIRKASTDGNNATVEDISWTPLLQTPAFQAYTSGHSTFSHAAATVLTSLLGENVAFLDRVDPGHAGAWPPLDDTSSLARRNYSNFRQAAEEAGLSRIYGGIHFSFDNTAGAAAGRSIGQLVATSALKRK